MQICKREKCKKGGVLMSLKVEANGGGKFHNIDMDLGTEL